MKKVLVIGGTGTLGQNLMDRFSTNVEITVLSRDEHKQQALQKMYPRTRFVLGDIRDKDSMKLAFRGVDTVFHVAALKCVDALELNCIEALKTNTIGSINVADLCIENNVKTCVFSSTDKAVYPINAYGNSKAMAERIFSHYNSFNTTKFKVYRWPNVIGSNGSAIPFFIKKLISGDPVPITDKRMTRFWIKITDAVYFVLSTMDSSRNLLIYDRLKSSSVVDVVDVLAEILRVNYTTVEVGLRPGEKLHEDMIAEHEGVRLNSENAPKFTRQELYELLVDLCRS